MELNPYNMVNIVIEKGMTKRRVWAGAPLSHSRPNYIIFSHPRPKPELGHVDEYPSLFTEKKNDKPVPACSNLDMYFCLDMKDDFPKTNNITPIHKILYEQIHSFHAYTLL